GHRQRVPLCRPALPVVVRGRPGDHRRPVVGAKVLRPMTTRRRCAIYTRKSTEEGLEQDFNSLHAQREACEAFIRSQRHEGWQVLPQAYDDGGYSGGTMDRPALSRLLEAAQSGTVDIIVVYKVDRLTRSLVDFAGWSSCSMPTGSPSSP